MKKLTHKLAGILLPDYILQAHHTRRQRDRYLKMLIEISSSDLRLVIGASGIFEKGWIPVEEDTFNLLDPGSWKEYVEITSVAAILAEHVWEHLSPEEGVLAAKTCYEYLRPGGYLRVAVPDGYHWSSDYITNVDVGQDGHQTLYTYGSLRHVMEGVGFEVELLEYHDEDHQFHYAEWDPVKGKVRRSKRFDHRNEDGVLNYTSIILDAKKPMVDTATPTQATYLSGQLEDDYL